MSFLDISDEKQLLVQVRPASRGLHLDLSRDKAMASSINCSPSSPTTTTSTTTTMHMMLTENEAARLRFEELQTQAEQADLSEVEATNCIYVAGVDKHNRPVVSSLLSSLVSKYHIFHQSQIWDICQKLAVTSLEALAEEYEELKL